MATDKIKFDKYILLRYFQEYLPVDKESATVLSTRHPNRFRMSCQTWQKSASTRLPLPW